MEWLFGGDTVDLTAAQRAIDQLTSERIALEDHANKLEDIIEQQRRRMKSAEERILKAQQDEKQAITMCEQADKADKTREQEAERLRLRLQDACSVLSLKSEVDALVKTFEHAETTAFPPPLVIAGPNGVGKATLIGKLFEEFPDDFALAVSHTSRKPLPDEEQGVNFYFAEREDLEKQVKDGKFVEVAEVEGDLYGTSIESVLQIRNAGKICVLHIDLAGMEQLKSSGLSCISLWVSAPSSDALRERLEKRGVESKEDLDARIAHAEEEERLARLRSDVLFDFHITNDTVDGAYSALKCVLSNYLMLEGRVPASRPEWRRRPKDAAVSKEGVTLPNSVSEATPKSPSKGGKKFTELTLEEISKDPKGIFKLKNFIENFTGSGPVPMARLTGGEALNADDDSDDDSEDDE